MRDTCGPMYDMPLAQYDRDGQCWKTSEATSLWALPMSSLTLPTWGCLRDGALYELPTPERPTIERGCSSLPTPRAQRLRGAISDYRKSGESPAGKGSRLNLVNAGIAPNLSGADGRERPARATRTERRSLRRQQSRIRKAWSWRRRGRMLPTPTNNRRNMHPQTMDPIGSGNSQRTTAHPTAERGGYGLGSIHTSH
jgi:hypothetical protein